MAEEKRGRGRPPGKKSNPDFTQISAYVRVKTYKETKKALIDEEMEISELVQLLLDQWLISRTQK